MYNGVTQSCLLKTNLQKNCLNNLKENIMILKLQSWSNNCLSSAEPNVRCIPDLPVVEKKISC